MVRAIVDVADPRLVAVDRHHFEVREEVRAGGHKVSYGCGGNSME